MESIFFILKGTVRGFSSGVQLKKGNSEFPMVLFNPKQAGGSESMYSLGGGVPRPPPWKKALENSYRVESMFIAQFFKASSLKKNLIDNFYSLGAREG